MVRWGGRKTTKSKEKVHRDLRLRHHVLAQPEIPRKTAVSVVPLHLVLLSAPPMPSVGVLSDSVCITCSRAAFSSPPFASLAPQLHTT